MEARRVSQVTGARLRAQTMCRPALVRGAATRVCASASGTRSERGDRFAERIMTVVRTARKQGRDVLAFLVRSIKASLDATAAPTLLVGAAA